MSAIHGFNPKPDPSASGSCCPTIIKAVVRVVAEFFTMIVLGLFEALSWCSQKMANCSEGSSKVEAAAVVANIFPADGREGEAKGMLALYEDLPRTLEPALDDRFNRVCFVASALGRRILETAQTTLSDEEIAEISEASESGTILYSTLMIRATIFQPKELAFPEALQGKYKPTNPKFFEAPSYLVDNQKQVVDLRKAFWALSAKDKIAILSHIDSECKETARRFELIPTEKKRPIAVQKVEISKAASLIYDEIRGIANSTMRGGIFNLTMQKSL